MAKIVKLVCSLFSFCYESTERSLHSQVSVSLKSQIFPLKEMVKNSVFSVLSSVLVTSQGLYIPQSTCVCVCVVWWGWGEGVNVSMCVHACVWKWLRQCVGVCVWVPLCVHACMCVRMGVCAYVRACTRVHVCVLMCGCARNSVCMCVHVCGCSSWHVGLGVSIRMCVCVCMLGYVGGEGRGVHWWVLFQCALVSVSVFVESE